MTSTKATNKHTFDQLRQSRATNGTTGKQTKTK